ncbi:hypothetical protein D9613_009219 [Agrocybe pediades]|uniref:Uncharacterized protein n=1 Tax=Agrocybe pediades TaxID=84607 RepID=A0A8H4R372_9AGAR|nr:hypothetical protein D9613_009219 [Agrocybe pediades]
MSLPDLPLELWLEIASHVKEEDTVGALKPFIGVSRTVFEFVMEKKYDKVCLDGRAGTTRILSRLREYPLIAKRVLHLVVDPMVLRNLDWGNVTNGIPAKGRVRKLPWTRRASVNNPPSFIFNATSSKMYETMQTIIQAIHSCSNLREVSVLVDRHPDLTASKYLFFLDLLWENLALFPNLQRVCINTTGVVTNAHLVTQHPLVVIEPSSGNDYFGLSYATLHVSTTSARLNPYFLYDWPLACKCLLPFLVTAGQHLTTLSIVSEDEDLGPVFAGLSAIPNLRTFELVAAYSLKTFSRLRQPLTIFLQQLSPSLEKLVIKPIGKTTTTQSPSTNIAYSGWLSDDGEGEAVISSFNQLIMPRLSALHIGLPEAPRLEGESETYALIPDLYHVAPMLTELVITEVKLTIEELVGILDGLAIQDGEIILQKLSYTCHELVPRTFDILSRKLPRLNSLVIEYDKLFASDGVDRVDEFIAIMHTRRYFSWPIRYLRLSQPCRHGAGHPSEELMKAIGSAISPDVLLDSKRCCC